jgi:REP element-mobilizing transposase RayT
MPTLLLAMLSWTTWGRAPLIKPGHAAALAGLLPKLAEKGGAELTELAVVSNHVHAILRIGPGCDLPRLVQYLKGGSALLLNRVILGQGRIRWAESHDLRSVDLRSLPQLRYYLNNQGRQHGVPLLVRWSVVKVEEELQERRRQVSGESSVSSRQWSSVASDQASVSRQPGD